MKIIKVLNGLDYLDTARLRNSGTIEIPDDIEEIGEGAFSHSLNLKNLNIPQNVKKIGSFAFCNCHNLKQISLNSYVNIHPKAFANCSGLEIITLSKNVYADFKYTPRLMEEYISYLKKITNNNTQVKACDYAPFENQEELK